MTSITTPVYITPGRLAFLGTFLFLSLTFSYLLIRFVPFFFRPEIFLSSPAALAASGSGANSHAQNLIVYIQKLPLEGKVVFTSSLTLNGRAVYIEENGFFRETSSLQEGVNTLVLEAKSRFGRKSEIVRRVIYIKN